MHFSGSYWRTFFIGCAPFFRPQQSSRNVRFWPIVSEPTIDDISFEIAARVFLDPLALACQDRIENGEYRWQTFGMVDGCLLLLVAHTVRQDEDGEVIRIISARKAGKKEQRHYEKKR